MPSFFSVTPPSPPPPPPRCSLAIDDVTCKDNEQKIRIIFWGLVAALAINCCVLYFIITKTCKNVREGLRAMAEEREDNELLSLDPQIS